MLSCRIFALCTLLVLTVSYAPRAMAITIGNLVSTAGSFSSGDGQLTFSDFAASSNLALSDLSGVEVSALSSGFTFDDTPLIGFEGTTASWEIAFTVTASSGFGLSETAIGFDGIRVSDSDPGLSESLLAATTNLGVSIFDIGPGPGGYFSASGNLDGSQSLRVELLLEAENFDTGGAIAGEGVASLTGFNQTFVVAPANPIPEPGAALLFGLGLFFARWGTRHIA